MSSSKRSSLQGKKTYIAVGVLIAYLLGCQIANKKPDETIVGILGSLIAAALRNGMSSATQGNPQ